MKKILGLDLGTTSIGWALVKEAENDNEKSEIIKLGVRLVPLSTDEKSNFEKGKSITTNAERTLKRSLRRNLQRYKLRRQALIEELKVNGWIEDDFLFSEQGPSSTFSTLQLRAKASHDEISLQDFAKVLLQINKKRGYKSSRKINSEDGQSIDGMEVAKEMYDNGLTPGELVYKRMLEGRYSIPEFYRSDLQTEFDSIWAFQKRFHAELSSELKEKLNGKSKSQTWTICRDAFNLQGYKSNYSGKERLKESYYLRHIALREELDLERICVVLQDINGQISSRSGLLSSISDRSKELYINGITVGQMLLQRIKENPNNSLKNIVFYRQDYLDEFECLWSTQSRFHPELNEELKKKLRDIIIFYQRPLKSQKGLVSLCEFEAREVIVSVDGVQKKKTIGPRVCPRSSPLFQEFKIWQNINNIQIDNKTLDEDQKQLLATELTYGGKIKSSGILKLLSKNPKNSHINFKEIDGDNTLSALLASCVTIAQNNGYDDIDFSRLSAKDRLLKIEEVFEKLGFDASFLHFDSSLESPSFESQKSYALWHLLYSYEGDSSVSGDDSLVEKIMSMCAMDRASAKILSSVRLTPDYGNLSAKAIRKVLPYMKDGLEYSSACAMAGYRHSQRSNTKEELRNREYVSHLDLLPRNSLRNPVVEKILNQMVNVVNTIVEAYGKPDEIRIELARELKKSAAEREQAQADISRATKENEKIARIIQAAPFNVQNPTRNDIIRYRLYKELEATGYHTFYSNTYVRAEDLYSKNFDIEHIIPQARLFDDSFANKTLESRSANLEKGKLTAADYVRQKYGDEGYRDYAVKIKGLLDGKRISRTKASRLLMESKDIPEDFINRELRDSQYIAKKAREILETMVEFVVPTTGSVTARLREDWQLVDIMRELNWDKYDRLGLTRYETGRDGRRKPIIQNWTKRNDHRHHAMDALTIAFTRRQFIQYLNHLNARIDVTEKSDLDLRDYTLDDIDFSGISSADRYGIVKALQDKYLYKDRDGKYRFIPPMPLDEFRNEAKSQIESVLVSFKAKNKVVTKNVNASKSKSGSNRKTQLTPRGSLHNETIYGCSLQYMTKEEKIGSSFDYAKINSVCSQAYRNALRLRLDEFGSDPKKAFTGKNSLTKNPLWLDEVHSSCVPEKVRTVSLQPAYTVRKPVDQNLSIDKVVDVNIRRILKARLDEYNGNAAKAFSNLDENPIWLNKEKGIAIKRVTIDAGVNPCAIRSKKDKDGKPLLDQNGQSIPSDYVATGNNHHIAIYRDSSGKIQENVVSFYEAVVRENLQLSVIDKDYKKDEGWEFLFTMKQNEYFVFPDPDNGFYPGDIDLTDPANYALISPHLFRVQKLTSVDYNFRHHLDTTVDKSKELRDITWKRITTPSGLEGIVKVRVDHIGRIVAIGEYD
ncbi:MAG: type II CRISPR RNA-guided endonuclease Cas9 [Candidatus Cryptobacteroides sp.]